MHLHGWSMPGLINGDKRYSAPDRASSMDDEDRGFHEAMRGRDGAARMSNVTDEARAMTSRVVV
jgi:hypothetical protein